VDTDEEIARTIVIEDLVVVDPDNITADFTLTVTAGPGYTVAADSVTITPDTDLNDPLTVPVTVNDGEFDSNQFDLTVTINPINDAPVITGQSTLSIPEETPLTITVSHLTIDDVDNVYPTDFTVSVQDGANYTRSGNTITSIAGFLGTLSVPVTVDDGGSINNVSDEFLLDVEVSSTNFAPQFTSTPFTDALVGVKHMYRITTTDLNEEDVLTITANVPAWLTFMDGGDGWAYLVGIPDVAEVGDCLVELTVTDSFGFQDWQDFTITVHSLEMDLAKADWLITADNEETFSADQGVLNAIDDDTATFWKSEWLKNNPTNDFPHWIEIDLRNAYDISGFVYTPRADKVSGRINDYEFYVSIDGVTWGTPVASGSFANTADPKEVLFPVVSAQFVRLEAINEVLGGKLASIAEFDILAARMEIEQESNEAPEGFIHIPFENNVSIFAGKTVNFAGYGIDPDGDMLLYNWDFGDPAIDVVTTNIPGAVQFPTAGTYTVSFTVTDALLMSDSTPETRTITVNSTSTFISKTNWSVLYVDSEEVVSVFRPAENVFDGDIYSPWQTEWESNNPAATYPHEIQIDLGADYQIEGFQYNPRPDKSKGRIKDFEFYVSLDGNNWGSPVVTGTFLEGDDVAASSMQERTFSVTPGRYIRLVALNQYLDTIYAAVAELNVLEYIDPNANQRPNGVINLPVELSVTIEIGGTVDFEGIGSDPDNDPDEQFTYLWDFGDPSISVSTLAVPGAITFNTPGTYTVSFTVTDYIGDSDLSPATKTVIVNSNSGVIDQAQMTIIYVDSEEVESANPPQGAVNVLDGDPATIWRTQWLVNDPDLALPHEIQIDLGDYYELDGFLYLPRQDKSSGRIGEFEFYVSWDDISWGSPVGSRNHLAYSVVC
jgi:F5/8 type C domain-containing protein/PKD domain-containing protein